MESLPEVLIKLPQAEQTVLIKETALQIRKDCNLSESEIPDEGSAQLLYPIWAEAILLKIKDMMKYNSSAFQALLYKVDLSEARVKEAFKNKEQSAQIVSGMIIYRCFQKIMTRRIFRQ